MPRQLSTGKTTAPQRHLEFGIQQWGVAVQISATSFASPNSVRPKIGPAKDLHAGVLFTVRCAEESQRISAKAYSAYCRRRQRQGMSQVYSKARS